MHKEKQSHMIDKPSGLFDVIRPVCGSGWNPKSQQLYSFQGQIVSPKILERVTRSKPWRGYLQSIG